MHHLAVAGESASQARVDQVHTSFLDSSQKTLTLVNETLELAKEASQRAADALKLRAERVSDRIEIRAREIAGPLIGKADLKEIVTDPEARLDIGDLAKEIASVQGYLEMQNMDLSPTCQFILGMNAHFTEDPRVAVRSLTRAAEDATNRDLVTASLYWAAYELNNIGKYNRATDLFRRARNNEKSATSRFYELQRLILETAFFELSYKRRELTAHERIASQEVGNLLDDIAEVRAAIPDQMEFEGSRAHLVQTEGNVRTWMAAPPWFPDPALSAERRQCLQKAQACYQQIVDKHPDELWPLFGLAESRLHLETGETAPSEETWSSTDAYEKIIKLASDQLTERAERRSRVSLDQTRLIAQVRLGVDRTDLAHTNDKLRENLSGLDRDMYLFSQAQKSNLPWADFEREIRGFWDDVEMQLREEREQLGGR